MDKQLFKLYDFACSCLNDENISTKDVVDMGTSIYVESNGELPNDAIKMVLGKCLTYTNHDFEKPKTINEYMVECEELVEEITGTLGEYFND